MSWFGKQSPHLASGEEVTLKKLFFYSVGFWLGLFILGLIFLLDFGVTSDIELKIFSSWETTQSFFFGLLVFAFFFHTCWPYLRTPCGCSSNSISAAD